MDRTVSINYPPAGQECRSGTEVYINYPPPARNAGQERRSTSTTPRRPGCRPGTEVYINYPPPARNAGQAVGVHWRVKAWSGLV
jgi:hypothetical protein